MINHWWHLSSSGVPVAPADIKATFETLRDHYANTTLVAGEDPRDSQLTPAMRRKVRFDGHEAITAQMDQGIRMLQAACDGSTAPVHATIRGVLRAPSDRRPGNELIVSVSVAQTNVGPAGIDGFES